jgi:hypothetical protein
MGYTNGNNGPIYTRKLSQEREEKCFMVDLADV